MVRSTLRSTPRILIGLCAVAALGQRTNVETDLHVGIAALTLDQQGQDVPGQIGRGWHRCAGLGKGPCQRGPSVGFSGVQRLVRDLNVPAQGTDDPIFVGVCKHVCGPLRALGGRVNMDLTHGILPGWMADAAHQPYTTGSFVASRAAKRSSWIGRF